MARMPGTEWVGPHHDNGVMSRYDIVCVHTIVGNPPAHAAHFSTRADGWIYQSRDTAFRSAANSNGNHRIIAVENDDFGPEFGAWNTADGHAVPGFTAAQIEAIAKICVWANKVHGIPLVACPDSRPTSRGIAFHRQGIDGNWAGYAYSGRVAGGEVWTASPGKVCPGDRRITQLITQIIPRARQLAGLEDDMTPEELLNYKIPRTGSVLAGNTTLWAVLANWDQVIEREAKRDAVLAATVAALSTRPDLDPAAVAAIIRDAVKANTPTAEQIAAANRPFLEDAIRDVVPAEQVDRIIQRLAEKLSAPEGN